VAVQCTLFDKSPTRNWLVALHQDLSIPVRERITHPDCTGWSEKEGVLFVQPPLSVLESLVAVRVHLDECGPGAGPLRVVPGSHRHGRLSDSEARHQRQTNGETECFAKRGDAFCTFCSARRSGRTRKGGTMLSNNRIELTALRAAAHSQR